VAVGGIYRIRKSAGLVGTPTLLIVDGNGIVRRVFEGALDSSSQQEFLSFLRIGVI
jgi:hypothetical protein